jgi:toxin secretion/phage lysis holin
MDFKIKNFDIKLFISGALTVITYLFNGWDIAVETLALLLVLDYITGIIAAYISGSISSEIGLKGILKKIMYLIVVAVAVRIDVLLSAGGWIRNATIYFFISNEGISILENAGKCGLKQPKILMDRLQQLQKLAETKDKENK